MRTTILPTDLARQGAAGQGLPGTAGLLGLATVLWLAGPVQASVIDFESVPGGSPSDQLEINSQYQSSYGVTFSLSGGGDSAPDNPHLEASGEGDSGRGFLNDARNTDDVADVGLEDRLGDFFLRFGTGGLQDKPVPTLDISYTQTVDAASGEIWDIDGHSQGDEQWQVSALGSGGSVLESLTSPRGETNGDASLDGEPWVWSFDRDADDIAAIQVSFVDDEEGAGTKDYGIGLAFDNFSPTNPATTVPVPGTGTLLVLGLAGVGLARRLSGRPLGRPAAG